MPVSSYDLEMAYLAGIMDGEGCICISRSESKYRRDGRRRDSLYRSSASYTLTVTVGMQDPTPPLMFFSEFGGSLVFNQKRRIWVWAASSFSAVCVLRTILPYLRGKKPQAEAAIKFQMERLNSGKFGRGSKITQSEIDQRHKAYRELRDLKQVFKNAEVN